MIDRPCVYLPGHSRLVSRALAVAVTIVAMTLGACGKSEPKPTVGGDKKGTEPRNKQSISETMTALLAKPDAEKRSRLIDRIKEVPAAERTAISGSQIVAVGLSKDFWTVDGKPAGILVTNEGDTPLVPTVGLGCYAPGGQAPKVTIDDGEGVKDFVFDPNGVRPYQLAPVPPKSTRLYIVTTDKTWAAGAPDNRKLGVQVLPPPAVKEAPAAPSAAK